MPAFVSLLHQHCAVCKLFIPAKHLHLKIYSPPLLLVPKGSDHSLDRHECMACACKALGLQPPTVPAAAGPN